MCNTLIISKPEFISQRIINELDIYIYENKINMKKIFEILECHNVRIKLIENNYLWENVCAEIYEIFMNFPPKICEQPKDLNNKILYVLNIINKDNMKYINLII